MKILQTETLVKTKFLDFKATEYESDKGVKGFWTWCSRPNGMKAVLIAAVVDKGWTTLSIGAGYKQDLRLVVIKEFRVPLADYEYSLPAGLIEKDEKIEDCVRREIFEETGLNLVKINNISPFVYNSAGLSDESISIVFCTVEGNISKDNTESSEEIETMICQPKEVEQILSNQNNKISAKTWLIFNWFVGRNFFE